MTIDEMLGDQMMGAVTFLANEIYYQKCLYHGVSKLSKKEETDCLLEAVRGLPAFLDMYKRHYEYMGEERRDKFTGERYCSWDHCGFESNVKNETEAMA